MSVPVEDGLRDRLPVLFTPYVERRHLPAGITATALTAGIVATVGLINDDGGALPDIDDLWEVILVVGTLMAQIAPIGLVVWLNNQLQLDHLARIAEYRDATGEVFAG